MTITIIPFIQCNPDYSNPQEKKIKELEYKNSRLSMLLFRFRYGR